ncbi:Phosphate:acyl-ACP acyltransferase PlsX [Patulibacter medicamentivorans]|uniref:Phosphate acyltransferase n=1 Tax=Patulibacter medicamentivorans TaxID=1097667 RepID=H0E9S9_9ACTN|nr:phosphate acyltransferase [Patulibacter medicamentivorans]EHN09578.1 Phosphate:acyl-ACP acyltransferase PlsX [Patulibacter medicamentivorans]
MTVTVAVDTTGADLGPAEVAQGALIAARQGIAVRLYGPAPELREVVGTTAGIEIVDAPLSIAKAPDPVTAVRANPDASIVQVVRAVASGDADAFVVAGATGPALAAGLLHVRRAKGIHRPALALPLPIPGKSPVTLVDVGANVESRPDHQVQFAFMGAALARTVLGIDRPRVALLSNGEEPTKGTPDVVEVHGLLRERLAGNPYVDFVGNVEGTDVTEGAADVVVTDGFTGNITLKLIEGVSQTVVREIRAAAKSNPVAMLGGLLLKPALGRFRQEIDPEGPGGAYLLGLRSLGVVPHGRFTRNGFGEAIVRAARGAEGDLVELVHHDLEAAGALRRAPAMGSANGTAAAAAAGARTTAEGGAADGRGPSESATS